MSIREKNQAIVEKFFTALEDMDANKVIELFDENIVQTMPYAPSWFPQKFVGKQQLAKQFISITDNFVSMKYDRHISPLLDENRFVVQFKGTIHLKSGQIYDNTYINLFTIKNDKIVEIIEYFDPIILEKGFKPKP